MKRSSMRIVSPETTATFSRLMPCTQTLLTPRLPWSSEVPLLAVPHTGPIYWAMAWLEVQPKGFPVTAKRNTAEKWETRIAADSVIPRLTLEMQTSDASASAPNTGAPRMWTSEFCDDMCVHVRGEAMRCLDKCR